MNEYDENYFLHGKQAGKSLYENYRWLPELTIPMVQAIVAHLSISKAETVLDFGCARGYVVRAFRELGYDAYGIDVSAWAVENADPTVKKYVSLECLKPNYSWILAKDVLEHVPAAADTVTELMNSAQCGVFAVVPLSKFDDRPYVIADYEKDVTHIHRLTLASWVQMFVRPGWRVECSYRVKGVKDNYAQFEKGNGFVTARRIHG